MKNYLLLFLLLIANLSYGQADTTKFNMQGTPLSKVGTRGYYASDSGFVNKPTDTLSRHVPLGTVRFDSLFRQWIFTGKRWLRVSGESGLDTAAALSLLTWQNLQNKPTTFPPADHLHGFGDVIGLQLALDSKAAQSALTDSASILRSLISASGIDTSALSARINQRVKYSDTAAMLAPYATKANLKDSAQLLRALIFASSVDTGSLSTRINQRVKYSDTPAMLAPYATKANLKDSAQLLRDLIVASSVDTASLSDRINQRVRYSDTAAMLAPYATKANLKDSTQLLRGLIVASSVDTSSLSARINQRVKYTDTAAMLAAYATKGNLKDTATALRALIGGAGSALLDTAVALRTADGQRVKYSDTAAMLSPYLRIPVAAATYAPISTAVTLTGTQTISNKTISAPVVTSVSSGTVGDSILVIDASTGVVKRISPSRISAGSTPPLSQVLAAGNNANNRIKLTCDTPSVGGGFSSVMELYSTNYPAFSLGETGSGSGHGWYFGMQADRQLKIFPKVASYGQSVVIGNGGITEGLTVSNSFAGAGIKMENTSSGGKIWYIFSAGTGYAAPVGSLGFYGGNAGYAFTMAKEGNVSIGAPAPDPSAILDLTSTDKGFLPPRMTSSQRSAMSVGANQNGMVIMCTDCTATDGSTGVLQMYQHSTTTWKNAF